MTGLTPPKWLQKHAPKRIPIKVLWDLVDKWRAEAEDIADNGAPHLNARAPIAAAQSLNSAAEDLSDAILDNDEAV